MAWGIGEGDIVFCPSWTYAATAEAIRLVKATPCFVDIDPVTYTLCPHSLRLAIEAHPNAKAIIAVDLFGDVVTTSFFPAKPLGCYGDGGAILTNDRDLSDTLKSLRFHGRGEKPGDHISIGLNSRLDTLQAAVLLEKLKIFNDEIKKRNQIADKYTHALKSNVIRTLTQWRQKIP